MPKHFDGERFDLVNVDSVHIPDYVYGHHLRGELDVWTTGGATGMGFVLQISVGGTAGALRHGVTGTACYFLLDRATRRYFFLERDARGFYLHDESFFGAATYFGDAAREVDAWLAGRPAARPLESGLTHVHS